MCIQNEFTWIEMYKDLSLWILDYEDRQLELISILKQLGDNIVKNDVDLIAGKSVEIPLKEIDPFSFFAILNSYKAQRLSMLKELRILLKFNCVEPLDLCGVPVANPMNVWLFPYKSDRRDSDIKNLWTFYKKIINGEFVDDNLFQSVLNIKQSGISKLTTGMFCIAPNKYLPINSGTNEVIQKAIDGYSKNNIESLDDVLSIMNDTIDYYQLKPYQISYDPMIYTRTIITLDNEAVYKISHSPKFFDDESLNYLKEKQWVVLHKDTGPIARNSTSQAQDFKDASIGDYIYVCYGNQRVLHIGKIKSEVEECLYLDNKSDDKGWLMRSYDILVEAIDETAYDQKKYRWHPSFNSTFYRIPENDISEANDLIFVPAFNAEFIDVDSKKSTISKDDGRDVPANVILYGPPGTGKTYALQHKYLNQFVDKSNDDNSSNRYDFIVFHQKYGYEDFIVGLTPALDNQDSGQLKFERKYGLFYNACLSALRLAGYDSFDACEKDTPASRMESFANAKSYAVLIDEINRANVSCVFGELISCIEEDKRIGCLNELFVSLPLGGGRFGVPSNLKIIGTMNTVDRSIAMIDIALRRRFEFHDYYPLTEMIERDDLKSIFESLNSSILKKKKSPDFTIGHSFLMKEDVDVVQAFNHKIIPLLYEFFQGNKELIADIIDNIGLDKIGICRDLNSQFLIKVIKDE